jgi:hypothetical protein
LTFLSSYIWSVVVCTTNPCDYFRDTNHGLEIHTMDDRWLLTNPLPPLTELMTAQDWMGLSTTHSAHNQLLCGNNFVLCGNTLYNADPHYSKEVVYTWCHLSCKTVLVCNQCSFLHLSTSTIIKISCKNPFKMWQNYNIGDHMNYSHKQIRCITFWVFLLPFTSHLPPKTLINRYSKTIFPALVLKSVGPPLTVRFKNWLHLRTCCSGEYMHQRRKSVQETA